MYLEEVFGNYIALNPNFTFGQIKLKFGSVRIYSSAIEKQREWEECIQRILDE